MRLKAKLLNTLLIPLVFVGILGLGGMMWSYYWFSSTIESDNQKVHAALEMEINITGVTQNVLDYVLRQDDESLQHYSDNINDVEKYLAEYKSLELNAEEQHYLVELETKYAKFKSYGDDLIDIEKKQHEILSAVTVLLNEKIEPVLDDLFQKQLKKNDSDYVAKHNASLEIEINAHELISATRGYALTAKPLLKKRVADSKEDIQQWIDVLSKTNLNENEMNWFKKLNAATTQLKTLTDKAVSLEDEKRNKITLLESLTSQMDKLLDDDIQNAALNDLHQTQDNIVALIYTLLVVILLIILLSASIAWLYTRNAILNPIEKVRGYAMSMAKGDSDLNVDIYTKDEIGDLAESFRDLISNTQDLTVVSKALGAGDFDAEVNPRSDKDTLGLSLLGMRNNLKKLDSDNKMQVWVKTQIASITQSMQGIRNLQQLLQAVIKELSTTIKAGVGTIYLKTTESEEGKYAFKLFGSYAYVDRKELSQEFKLGEGIVGQCAQEAATIVISDIPDSYVEITSGCGKDKPKCIIAVPVMHENDVLGVMEFASFELFNNEQREIIKSVSENLGIIINNVVSHQRTEELLEESQTMTEELQSQQEELKASNEELEEKTKVLKESEEELKASSEELQAANEELEEKSERLKAQNEDIARKNIEVEEARSEVEQRAKDLALASKYKSEFLANMSHELRTPLNSLLILSKDLENNKPGNLNDKQVECAKVIHEGGQDLLTLINDILDLSKVESGKLQVDVSSIDIQAFLNGLKTQFDPIVSEKGLSFIVEIGEGVNRSFDSDEQRLSQIIKNLCFNAVKFTNSGSITIKVTKVNDDVKTANKALVKDGAIAFSVIDSGIGISPDKQREIFEAFQQGDGSTNRNYGGTGLGLAISRAMAELLGGEITLSSELDKGSCFTLILPLAIEDGKNTDCEQISSVSASTTLEKPMPSKAKEKQPIITNKNETADVFIDDDRENIGVDNKVLLIIEDDTAFAKILQESAKEKGYLTLCAGDGHNGLTLAKQFKPSAIVLDVGLPDVDGLQVLEQLKFDLDTRHIPIHIVSAHEEIPVFKQKGAIGYMLKPAESDQLPVIFEKIESVLDGKIKNVLVVEDDEKSHLAISHLIDSENVEIDQAYNANEAHEKIIGSDYDCIILDLCLPDISGFELLKQLKKEGVDAPPVIVYTGRELEEDEHNELRRYATSIVLKGAESPERLLDEISLFLHSVESELPDKQKQVIQMLHNSEQLLANRRVLLVDDDVRNVFALSSTLEDYGLDIIVASNGKVALDKLSEEDNIELVIMDIMMPVMDGYEAMQKIRQQNKYVDLPIIALTAKAMTGDREKCIESGANDYITKPVDVEKLVSMIKVWLFK
ncbi:MAG: response regulator [Coxiellaceae bacterium]|nr:response regulator [Coxiellaceae bacterium]